MIRSRNNAPPEYNPRSMSPLDRHIGARVRLARQLAGLTQEELAAHLGLTFQQVQKYERGANRVSASRLLQIAQKSGQPMSFFYASFDDAPELESSSETSVSLEGLSLSIQQAREVLVSLDALKPSVRQRALALVKAVAS